MTAIDLHPTAAQGHSWIKLGNQVLTRALDRLLDWSDRARQRRELLGLSDAALADFAASRADAVGQGDRPFWRD